MNEPYSFNMSMLYNMLVDKHVNDKNINIVYDPNRYSAIKVIFYKDYNGVNIKLSMCIFRSGKINVMGTRTEKHRSFLYKFAHDWFTSYNEYIVLLNTTTKDLVYDTQLTIHDLI